MRPALPPLDRRKTAPAAPPRLSDRPTRRPQKLSAERRIWLTIETCGNIFPNMNGTIEKSIELSLARLLTPLVRLLLRYGVP
ncbi:MAG: hypothetical protein O7A67_09155, partial [SAR324 cluster bacterium]|nr:hypothetical protein [SAR324 cluster bacterium]